MLTAPTIFGAQGAHLLGGGEAGPEAVAPIDVLQGYVAAAVERAIGKSVSDLAAAVMQLANRPIYFQINGRTIASGLLSEIWAAAQHNSRNRFLAIVDLCCPDSNALPDTKSAKNGFREGDPKLANLYQWLRSTVPLPHVSTPIEAVLMNHLAEVKRTDAANLLVCREERVFKELPLKASVDLLVSTTDGITIYEGKVHYSKAQDVYQLQMYADGCAHDGCPVKEAILVAETHPDGVRSLVNHINQTHDLEYSIRLTTWAEERIPYEALLNNCRY